MQKKCLQILRIACIMLFLPFSGRTQYYTAGGEVSYKFLYKSIGEYVYDHYEVTIKLYKECGGEGSFLPSVDLAIYVANPPPVTPLFYAYPTYSNVPLVDSFTSQSLPNNCSPPDQALCLNVAIYKKEIAVEENWGYYILAVQDYSRKFGYYGNVAISSGDGSNGFTYFARFPGMLFTSITSEPSSPVFKKENPFTLCTGQTFHYDFSASDPDGDSLVYSFAPARKGYDSLRRTNGEMPPFGLMFYYSNFSWSSPLGASVQMDPKTGMVSGTGPPVAGRYTVVGEVAKYRNGELVSKHTKEVLFKFSNCQGVTAELDSVYKNCKSTTVHFNNYSTGNIVSYLWDFGDPTTTNDFSSLAEPTYHYPFPGIYQVKLYLNKGTSLCKDSAFATVIVDSGLVASFDARRSLAACNQAFYTFTSTSTEGMNPITSYSWNFGEISATTDTSSLQNPSYLYPREGNKNVRLIISNDMGCADTAFKTLQAFVSLLQASNDTTICILDTIQLHAYTNGYPGIFKWKPNYNISNVDTASPWANPQTDTTYYISFTDTTGCAARDSVRVSVRDDVNISILNADTSICRLDTIVITTIHDGLSVTWQPSGSVLPIKPDGSIIKAFPYSTTDLIATAHFGSCFSESRIHIKVTPQPQVTVNSDTIVCLGAPVYLHATGGAFYLWAPAATLNNPLLPDPVAHPVANTIYTVSVYDTLGCPKHTMATVKVSTFRGLVAVAEKDTMVVMGEPVQLTGYGGQYYHWSPSLYLSDQNIPNPVSRPYDDIIYTLRITNDDECADSAKVRIRAFKDPDIYVPTAFTPNNDGLNDLFKVFPIGFILEELKIFDRWGNLLFATNDYNKGWDGKYKGEILAAGTFVWMASGKNIKTGVPVFKKGNITLIR